MRRRPMLVRFWERVVPQSVAVGGCWEWSGSRTAAGYGVIGEGGREGRHIYAHRLSYEIHNGPIPAGLHVLHACDNPRCVNPTHLSVGTQRDNMADMIRKGRNAVGERYSRAKLNREKVIRIRERYAAGGVTQELLAAEHGVSRGCIEHVVQRSTWRHV